jgi:predicted metalloprotease with PDZ domain
MDMLALLNWTLPELTALLPEPLTRLTIVSAGSPMWRGGLSAPASIYIHKDRPLISENATSTLLHEVVHTAMSIRTNEGSDWIAEGLAEYYSLQLLKRGSAISARRYASAVSEQADWAGQADALCGTTSTGATTALAVTVFHALDQEIRDRTAGASNLDELLRQLVAADHPIDVTRLSDIAAEIIGEPSDALHIDKLPGCSKIRPGNRSN